METVEVSVAGNGDNQNAAIYATIEDTSPDFSFEEEWEITAGQTDTGSIPAATGQSPLQNGFTR